MQLRALQDGMQKRLGEWSERVNHLRLVPKREEQPGIEVAPRSEDAPARKSGLRRILSKLPRPTRMSIPWSTWRGGRSKGLGFTRIAGEDRVAFVRLIGDRLHAEPLADLGQREDGAPASKSRRGQGRVVSYALSDISCSHERLELPPIEDHLLPPVIEQRAGDGNLAGSEMEIAWVPVKTTPTLRDLLVVTIDRQVAHDAAMELQDDGYQVRRIVTPEVALAGLLRTFGKTTEHYSTQAIVHLGERIGSVGFVVDDELALGREFPLAVGEESGSEDESGAVPGDASLDRAQSDALGASAAAVTASDGGGELIETVIEEVSRSLMLLNHRLQGRKVERILLASDCHPIERVRAQCHERFHVPVELVLDAVDVDISAFGEGEIARRRAAEWVLPIASAAVGMGDASKINLLPARIRQSRALRKLVLGLSCGLVVGALGMSLAHTHSLRQTADLKDTLEEAVRHLEMNQYRIEELEDLYVGRMQASARHDNLVARREPLLWLQSTMNHISHVIPQNVSLERLDFGYLRRDDPALTMRIQGEVRSPNVADVQAQFNEFVKGLRQRPELSGLFVQPVQIETPLGESTSRLIFDITIPFAQSGGEHDRQD